MGGFLRYPTVSEEEVSSEGGAVTTKFNYTSLGFDRPVFNNIVSRPKRDEYGYAVMDDHGNYV